MKKIFQKSNEEMISRLKGIADAFISIREWPAEFLFIIMMFLSIVEFVAIFVFGVVVLDIHGFYGFLGAIFVAIFVYFQDMYIIIVWKNLNSE